MSRNASGRSTPPSLEGTQGDEPANQLYLASGMAPDKDQQSKELAEIPSLECRDTNETNPGQPDGNSNVTRQNQTATSLAEDNLELAKGDDTDTNTGHRTLAEVPPLARRDSIQSTLPVIDKTKLPPRQIYENKIVIGASLIPMSILGTLIRVGLQRLESYDGTPVFGLVYAQWIGCFIMGIVVEDKAILIHYYLPLQVALSTGLCGSITTFSSWQRDVFEAFANYGAANHNKGYNILAAISQFLVTMAMSFNGLLFGFHVGRVLGTRFHISRHRRIEIVTREFSTTSLTARDWFIILFGYLTWIGVIFAAAFTSTQRDLALACVFAPVGALARWHLSVLNTYKPPFFWGTFAANMLGTAVLAALSLVESGVIISSITCDVIKGLTDGLCGCLTTISTFVVELSNLPLRHSYIYGMSSVILGQCLMFVIFGPYIWTQGVNPTC